MGGWPHLRDLEHLEQSVPGKGVALDEEARGVVDWDFKIGDPVAAGDDVGLVVVVDAPGQEIDPDGVAQRFAADVLEDRRAGLEGVARMRVLQDAPVIWLGGLMGTDPAEPGFMSV